MRVAPENLAPSSGERTGLTSAEAARQLAHVGPNMIEQGSRFEVLRTLLGFFASPLVLILLVASLVAGALGDVVNAGIIAAMVVLSVALDFFQSYRSQRAANALRGLVAPTARVRRDGAVREVPVAQVVPGDVFVVQAGDLVPADATLVQAASVTVDEAALTGESLPVEKRVDVPDPAGRSLFAGTSVVSGVGEGLVTETGPRTQFGAIAHALAGKAPPTEFERGARGFGTLIVRTILALVLLVFLVNTLLRRDPLETLLFCLALAVGLTPEFLPMIITVTLAQGAQRMARTSKVIVKRLPAIENLGNMDVLCSDKTGTLTKGQIELECHVDLHGEDAPDTLKWACVNGALESGVKSHLDQAILAHDHPAIGEYRKLAEIPFDYERRRVSVLAAGPEGHLLVTKGAPDGLLPVCTRVHLDGQVIELTPDLRGQAQATLDRLSRDGFLVLGIAWKPCDGAPTAMSREDERELVLEGFAAFLDPPDPTARESLASLRASGVTVKILTGDSDLVARTICQQVGLPVERVVLGEEMTRMSEAALGAVAEQTDVFARVTPAQKDRVIQALKRRKHVVGYLGDGINDAPSLHVADVGISVSNAVDVARAAAEIILLEKSLAAIHRGVMEGRRSFANITKYVLMGTSSNFGNMLSMAFASAVLPFLPLLPVQVLLNNFLYDVSQLTIPSDNVDDGSLARPRRWDTALIRRFMLGVGPISSLYDFLTFGVMLFVFHASAEVFRAGWFIESLATQTLVIFVIRTVGNPLKSRPSRALLLSVIGSVLVGVVLVVSPVRAGLGFGPLPLTFFAVLVVMTVTYLGLVQVLKGHALRDPV